MLWFCRLDSRAFTFCSCWEQTVEMKSLTYLEWRQTFAKVSIGPQLPLPCAQVPQWHALIKPAGTSLAWQDSSEFATLLLLPLLLLAWHCEQQEMLYHCAVGTLPCPPRKGFPGFLSLWLNPLPAHNGPWMREDSNPVYLSLHLHMSPPVRAWSLQVTQTEAQQMTMWENAMLLGPYDLLSPCC